VRDWFGVPFVDRPIRVQIAGIEKAYEAQLESVDYCLSVGDYNVAMWRRKCARDLLYREIKARMKVINLEYCE